MSTNRISPADRSTHTQAALLAAARPQFAAHGYAGASTEAIVRTAGVTRGAMYHHFADKTELFAAVFAAVEREVMDRIGTVVATSGESDPVALMRRGAGAWLDVCADPEVQRIMLVDAPGVLGWQRFREICLGYGLGQVHDLVAQAIAAGRIPAQPTLPLAHLLIGAMDEAALYIAQAADQTAARAQMGAALDQLITALASPRTSRPRRRRRQRS
ncbi:MAG TPA: TetR/AcrR family transcriptional regulator [Jatrophihabitans sp.]|nr:TetR/AcrR family transcriptional regulator [Jatrophihabitans sp.]